MLKKQNTISIKEEIKMVRKFDFDLPEKNKTKLFINNWLSPFLLIIRIYLLEKIKNLNISTYSISKQTLEKLLLIDDKIKIIGANNLLLANRSRSGWIVGNIDLILTDNHSKVALVQTLQNFYVIFGSGNYGLAKVGKLEQLTITNNEKLFYEIKNHFKKIEENVSTKRK